MAKQRLLVTGASGTLGGPLTQRAVEAGWDVTAAYYSRPDRIRAGTPLCLDLRDEQAALEQVSAVRPDVIIHAAVTERSGAGFDEAIRLAGRHVARAAQKTGARLIALSTDLVFDGSALVYTEDTPPCPMPGAVYGRAKAEAEHDILSIYPAALIVRTSLLYDFDRENAQVSWMLRAVEQGEKIRLYVDQIRCPIWSVNLADALLELATMDVCGLLHVVGPEPVSRYDLGAALLAALGFDPALHIIPTHAPDTHPRRLILGVDRARSLLRDTPLLTLAQARAQHS